MPATFSWFLALRYLVTRWVHLLGMCGVAVAGWAMIVVIAVMSGFIEGMTDSIHNASPDLRITKLKPGCTESQVRPFVEADPDVVRVAPRILQDAMVFPYGRQLLTPVPTLELRTTTQGHVGTFHSVEIGPNGPLGPFQKLRQVTLLRFMRSGIRFWSVSLLTPTRA